jgi:hypothetical protein
MMDITIEEVLERVTFKRDTNGTLYVISVRGSVWGNVEGNVQGNVLGFVSGDVKGNVFGNVFGNVWGSVEGNVGGSVGGNVCGGVKGTIKGRYWQFVETPKEKAIRLIREGNAEEAIKVLEENDK